MAFDEPVQDRRLPDARGPLDEHDAGTLRRDLVEHAVQGVELMPPAGEQGATPGSMSSGGVAVVRMSRSAHPVRLVRFGPLDRIFPLNGRHNLKRWMPA